MSPEENNPETTGQPDSYGPDDYTNTAKHSARESPPRNSERSVLEILCSDAAKHNGKLKLAAAIILALSAIFFFPFVKSSFFIIAFIGIGAVSRMWQRFIPVSIGVELVMLFTVTSGVLFGPLAGLIVGFLSLSISTLVTQEDIAKMWPSFFVIAVVGYLAGALTISNISFAGLMFTVFYDAVISIIYIAIGHSIIKTLIFDATHIAFNYFVFYHVAPVLIALIG